MAYGESYLPKEEEKKEDAEAMAEVEEKEESTIKDTIEEVDASKDATVDLKESNEQEHVDIPTMSQEQVLLLQLLRRAKRQQDLIIEIQKMLKALDGMEKSVHKTIDQIKQIQFA